MAPVSVTGDTVPWTLCQIGPFRSSRLPLGLSPGLVLFSARSIARLLHRALLPGPELGPGWHRGGELGQFRRSELAQLGGTHRE
jgi:hypothetical protein